MIRVVLDTNVLVAALLTPTGNPAQLIEAIRSHQLAPAYSSAILTEYREVLSRLKFGFIPAEIEGLIELVKTTGVAIEPHLSLSESIPLSPDPEDSHFILCAVASEAKYLVTGNVKHFPLLVYGDTRVVLPREMLEYLKTQQSQ